MWTSNLVLKRAQKLQQCSGGRALASIWNDGQTVLAERMVTHNWSNIFVHLVAGIVADSLGLDTFEDVALQLMDFRKMEAIRAELKAKGALEVTYWVCAMSVN